MPSCNPKTAAIILAAGASNRMNGSPKQLLEIGGSTLLRRSTEIALAAAFGAVVVVLGANAALLRREIEDLPLEITVNENWADGISSSIRAGIKRIAAREFDAALFVLCDQPLITTEILLELRDAFVASGNRIAACRYAETVGVPALFARELFGELMNLRGDEGAKKLIARFFDDIVLIDAQKAALDVDTPEDFEKLKSVYPSGE